MTKRGIPDPTNGWADGRGPYLWDKQLDGESQLALDVRPRHWREPRVRRALFGLLFVVLVFVVAPVVAMLATSSWN